MLNTYMKKTLPLFAYTFSLIFLSSCGLYKDKGYQQVSYYQDVSRADVVEPIKNFQPLKIQSGDLLGVNVNSMNPEASSVFNTNINRVNGNSLDASATNPIYGFRVDADGQVQLPLVGALKLGGMTTDQAAKKLSELLLPYLKNPIVNVRILNFRVSVLGDVLRPDTYTIQNEHININEALSLAGDLNITAKRKNVLLVREENGQRHYITIDLTSKNVFDSPYYYLHNNDIIYVDADKTKYDNVARSYKSNTLLISSSIALLAILASAFFVYNR
jgi:polysaccharide export outer membrane protein